MLISGSFLIIEDRDVISLSLSRGGLVTIAKHFLDYRGRSYLCRGVDCKIDHGKFPPRLRYQAPVVVDGESLTWEFGDDVYRTISRLPAVEGWVKITVTRLGGGRKTRYQVTEQQYSTGVLNKYTSGKYGHMVQT